MKVSVITVINTRNYGTVLQTAATKAVFEELGCETEFIDYTRKGQTPISAAVSEFTESRHGIIKKMMLFPIRIADKYRAKLMFRNFLQTHIVLTKRKYFSFEELASNPPDADLYCTGSDQTWNSGWNNGLEKSFFLEYAPENKKRISFSTSIGKSEWDEAEYAQTAPLLKKYAFITVREKSAVEILAKCGIHADWVLDPTMMVYPAFWKSFIRQNRPTDEKYLLVYQLHQAHGNVDFNQQVERISKEKGLAVKTIKYDIMGYLKHMKSSVYLPTPEQFLNWIYYADYIVTDSFHGTAFSLNFEKQLSVICPERYSTRMRSILELTGLQDRIVADKKECPDRTEIEYSSVRAVLESSRKESISCIRSHLETLG